MPSPFPGMDPYLEDPNIFPDLHDRLIVYISDSLNVELPAPYYTGIGTRVWVETSQRRVGPDVKVLRPELNGGVTSPAGSGGIAVATEPVVIHVPHDEIRETFVEVYFQPGQRLVTIIEVLSWTNKTPGEHGQDLYKKKQMDILGSKVHLVEIDLLRGATHTTAISPARLFSKVGPVDYHVCIHHFDNLEDYFVYPVRLLDRLPVIAIPLLPGDSPVNVDLQALLDRCYDAGNYRRRVRYGEQKPIPALSPEPQAWAEKVLREKGFLG